MGREDSHYRPEGVDGRVGDPVRGATGRVPVPERAPCPGPRAVARTPVRRRPADPPPPPWRHRRPARRRPPDAGSPPARPRAVRGPPAGTCPVPVSPAPVSPSSVPSAGRPAPAAVAPGGRPPVCRVAGTRRSPRPCPPPRPRRVAVDGGCRWCWPPCCWSCSPGPASWWSGPARWPAGWATTPRRVGRRRRDRRARPVGRCSPARTPQRPDAHPRRGTRRARPAGRRRRPRRPGQRLGGRRDHRPGALRQGRGRRHRARLGDQAGDRR